MLNLFLPFTVLSSIENTISLRGTDTGAVPRGHEKGRDLHSNRGSTQTIHDVPAPGVDSPIEDAIALRGADEGAADAPIVLEDSTAAGDRSASLDTAPNEG